MGSVVDLSISGTESPRETRCGRKRMEPVAGLGCWAGAAYGLFAHRESAETGHGNQGERRGADKSRGKVGRQGKGGKCR